MRALYSHTVAGICVLPLTYSKAKFFVITKSHRKKYADFTEYDNWMLLLFLLWNYLLTHFLCSAFSIENLSADPQTNYYCVYKVLVTNTVKLVLFKRKFSHTLHFWQSNSRPKLSKREAIPTLYVVYYETDTTIYDTVMWFKWT